MAIMRNDKKSRHSCMVKSFFSCEEGRVLSLLFYILPLHSHLTSWPFFSHSDHLSQNTLSSSSLIPIFHKSSHPSNYLSIFLPIFPPIPIIFSSLIFKSGRWLLLVAISLNSLATQLEN